MAFTTNDPIVAASRGNTIAALSYAKKRNAARIADVESYVNELDRLCRLPEVKLDFALLFGQWCDETGVGSTEYWKTYLNPAGIGALETMANPGVVQYVGKTYVSGAEAARAQVVHMYVYAVGKIPAGHVLEQWISLDPRYDAVIKAGYAGNAKTIGYLSGRWAANPNYANQIINHCQAAFDAQSSTTTPADQNPNPNASGPYASLPFPVTVWLVDPRQTNQRPGIKQKAKWVNVHETGNTRVGADAKMHAQWQHDGCPGVPDAQIGVHFYVDDKQAYQMLPLDEVSWNAGCGNCEGNYAAISFEICVNADADRAKARQNATKLIANVMKQLGLGEGAIKFHQDWSGKWCPAIILNEGRKEEVRQMIVTELRAIGGSSGGTTTNPTSTTYAAPSPVPGFDGTKNVMINKVTFYADKRTVTASQAVRVRKYADFSAAETRKPLSVGEKFNVLGWVYGQEQSGEKRWWITATYSRVWVGGTTEKPK